MAVIGKFIRETIGFSGTIATLTCSPAAVTISSVKKPNANAPDYRVYRGEFEVGAAWSKTARNGRDYLVVSLDDPAFDQAITARLVVAGDSYTLLWSRE